MWSEYLVNPQHFSYPQALKITLWADAQAINLFFLCPQDHQAASAGRRPVIKFAFSLPTPPLNQAHGQNDQSGTTKDTINTPKGPRTSSKPIQGPLFYCKKQAKSALHLYCHFIQFPDLIHVFLNRSV